MGKKNYNLPKPIMTSADFMEIIRDENIRKHLKAPQYRRHFSSIKLNPLKNEKQLVKLNPYSVVEKDLARARQAEGLKRKQEKVKRLAQRESLAKRKLLTEVANKAAKRRNAKLKQLKRHQKAYKVMKKFMEKTRAPRKMAEDKTIQTAEEKKEYRQRRPQNS